MLTVFMNTFFNLEERLLEFAADVTRMCESMTGTHASRHVAGQLLRSATSPMAHHGEAQAAESRNDFIHKMKVAHKELRESIRWLRLAHRVPLVTTSSQVESLIQENDELIRIFHASLRTAQSRQSS